MGLISRCLVVNPTIGGNCIIFDQSLMSVTSHIISPLNHVIFKVPKISHISRNFHNKLTFQIFNYLAMAKVGGGRSSRSGGTILDADVEFPPMRTYEPKSELPTFKRVICMIRLGIILVREGQGTLWILMSGRWPSRCWPSGTMTLWPVSLSLPLPGSWRS